jgi:hypothetical protein
MDSWKCSMTLAMEKESYQGLREKAQLKILVEKTFCSYSSMDPFAGRVDNGRNVTVDLKITRLQVSLYLDDTMMAKAPSGLKMPTDNFFIGLYFLTIEQFFKWIKGYSNLKNII